VRTFAEAAKLLLILDMICRFLSIPSLLLIGLRHFDLQ